MEIPKTNIKKITKDITKKVSIVLFALTMQLFFLHLNWFF
jgi:hypothetical protein